MDPRPVQIIKSRGGIQRDGTVYDSEHFVDGQWVRFYRGRARKMGGFRSVVEDLQQIPRGMFVSSKNNIHNVYLGSSHGIRRISTDNTLTSSISYDVTPTTFVSDANYSWQFGALFDATGGGEVSILAHGAKNVQDISSTENLPVYSALAGSSSAFAPISDGASGQVEVSGGICVLQPYVVAYGNDGLLKVCNANNFNDWQVSVGNEADEVNVAYTKIVQGLPIRGGGQAPAGLFWSLESLIKMSWNNSTVWNYDPLGFTTLMSSNATVEVNGLFFWMGVDRFYVYNGKIDELPNQMNINWVFDNLNFEQRQKVWATVVPRFGEIWWHFPFGSGQIECNRAVIFNYVEKTWYDCQIERSSGFPAQVLKFPLWSGNILENKHDRISAVTVSNSSPAIVTWEAHGLTAGTPCRFTTTGYLPNPIQPDTTYYVYSTPTDDTFTLSENIDSSPISTTFDGSGIHTATALSVPSYSLYGHEYGSSKTTSQSESSILSYVETSDLGVLSAGNDYNTRISRVEPDFLQTEDMTMTVITKRFSKSSEQTEREFTFSPDTEKIDMKEQGRVIRLRFTSNSVGGFFEQGKVLIHTEPGDIRP